MTKLDDKAYVMAQLQRAKVIGKLDEAMAVLAATEQQENDATTNWARIRDAMDEMLDVLTVRSTASDYPERDGDEFDLDGLTKRNREPASRPQ